MTAVQNTIFETLPDVRGRYTEKASLGKKSWFGCGGTADIVFKPKDHEDLKTFLENCPADIPIHTFGVLSNSIIRDGGIRGVVIRFGREFGSIDIEEDRVTAGALALDANVAKISAEKGVGGLEFLSGIPGSVGGALKMNAGCYGTETKDVLIECEVFDRAGKKHILKSDDMKMTYRHTEVPDDFIFTKALFQGEREKASDVLGRIEAIKTQREESQPIREKTGGSTFANPAQDDLVAADLSTDTKVWQLIEKVGGRGLMVGGAQMSEKHCNFMINTGEASASDLEALGEEIRRRVLDQFGITLRWEIKRVGEESHG